MFSFIVIIFSSAFSLKIILNHGAYVGSSEIQVTLQIK